MCEMTVAMPRRRPGGPEFIDSAKRSPPRIGLWHTLGGNAGGRETELVCRARRPRPGGYQPKRAESAIWPHDPQA